MHILLSWLPKISAFVHIPMCIDLRKQEKAREIPWGFNVLRPRPCFLDKGPLLVIERVWETDLSPTKTITDTSEEKSPLCLFICLDLHSGLPSQLPYVVILLISHHLRGNHLKVKLL